MSKCEALENVEFELRRAKHDNEVLVEKIQRLCRDEKESYDLRCEIVASRVENMRLREGKHDEPEFSGSYRKALAWLWENVPFVDPRCFDRPVPPDWVYKAGLEARAEEERAGGVE